MNLKKLALLVAVMSFNPAFAGDTEVSLEDANTLIRKASNNNMSVERVFEGPNDMTGAVMFSPEGKGIAWIPSDGKNIMIGTLMDDTGKNLSLAAHEQYIGNFDKKQPVAQAPKQVDPGNGLMTLIEKLPSVSFGNLNSKKTLYVFGDVNCHYCEDLFKLLNRTNLNDFNVKWIPVSVLGEQSLDQAATLLNLPANKQFELLAEHHGPTRKAIERMSHDVPTYTSLKALIDYSGHILSTLGTGTPLLAYWNGSSVDIIPRGPTKQELDAVLQKIQPR